MVKIVDYIFRKPIINAEEIIKNLNLNKMTTYNLIYKLESLDIFGGQRNRVYWFVKYLDLSDGSKDIEFGFD